MNLRIAEQTDLTELKTMYQEIVADMKRKGLEIWDEIYPSEFLSADIEENRLYLLMEQKQILGAFALCETNEGDSHVNWKNPAAKVRYLDRLGVNANCLHRGIGGMLLEYATTLAREQGAEYLRLFVVDSNTPAIHLYEKSGFIPAVGIYAQQIDDFVLYEYGYEKELVAEI